MKSWMCILSCNTAHTTLLHDKAERRVLEEELTVHLSVPGDTILINNRPGSREPPPYQEPRPRGNPPHSAPSVANGSGKTCLVPILPSSSLPVSYCIPFPLLSHPLLFLSSPVSPHFISMPLVTTPYIISMSLPYNLAQEFPTCYQ